MNFKHSCRQRARTPSHLLSAHYCLLPLTRKSIFRWCTNPTGNFHAGRCGGRSHTELTVTRGIGIGKLAGSGRAEPEARRPPRPACDPPPLSNSWPPSTWSAMGEVDEFSNTEARFTASTKTLAIRCRMSGTQRLLTTTSSCSVCSSQAKDSRQTGIRNCATITSSQVVIWDRFSRQCCHHLPPAALVRALL